jgi:hypothetical protein
MVGIRTDVLKHKTTQYVALQWHCESPILQHLLRY